MNHESLIVSPGQDKGDQRFVYTENNQRLDIPEDWCLLPPGDAAVTRTLKTLGPTWTSQRKKGRKTFSQGVWAPRTNIEQARRMVAAKREDPAYAWRRAADIERRQRKQEEYVEDFIEAVLTELHFHPDYADLAVVLAGKIAAHATPVGSGTVARTQRIPMEQRARAAIIAWMRHQTTAYDHMQIARVKGRRREVRRQLAQQSRHMLEPYRRGDRVDLEHCPLYRAVWELGS